jgi:hypothetical protein
MFSTEFNKQTIEYRKAKVADWDGEILVGMFSQFEKYFSINGFNPIIDDHSPESTYFIIKEEIQKRCDIYFKLKNMLNS